MIAIIISLFRIGVLMPKGLIILMKSMLKEGTNLCTLLLYSATKYKDRVALVQGEQRLTYEELYLLVLNQASCLLQQHHLKQGQKVAILSRNTVDFSVLMFALSRIGVDVVLLNPEISKTQLDRLSQKYAYDLLIFEHHELAKKFVLKGINYLLIHELKVNQRDLSLDRFVNPLAKVMSGQITVLTSGTTGEFKAVSRRQRFIDFLYPLSALVNKIALQRFKSIYIAVPFYHGFGLAAMIVSILLGTEIHIARGFDEKKAIRIIEQNHIQVVALVPSMLVRMLNASSSALKGVKRIVSGGAALSPSLIAETFQKVGSVLYNLYGTTEAGFCILATPKDLLQYPEALGKAIHGVALRLASLEDIGELEVKSKWSVRQGRSRWVKTGDLAYIDQTKLVFLKGRVDSMIVSGGENVYPLDLENVMSQHPQVYEVSVIGVPDISFGQRLKAFVVLKKGVSVSETELKDWLKARVARYQMPAQIVFLDELPLSSIGKVNTLLLSEKM